MHSSPPLFEKGKGLQGRMSLLTYTNKLVKKRRRCINASKHKMKNSPFNNKVCTKIDTSRGLQSCSNRKWNKHILDIGYHWCWDPLRKNTEDSWWQWQLGENQNQRYAYLICIRPCLTEISTYFNQHIQIFLIYGVISLELWLFNALSILNGVHVRKLGPGDRSRINFYVHLSRW
jgi:hypothetical protein